MKRMKNAAALLLALMMILSLSVTAFAANETTDPIGSISINGVSTDNVYSIYKLLDLESYDTDSGAYSYKVNSDWTGFFATVDAKKYFTVDEQGYATWVGGDAADFAKLALAYAKTQVPVSEGSSEKKDRILPVKSSHKFNEKGQPELDGEGKKIVSGDMPITGNTGKFSNLELGYYLIDSTMGALCGLTTTNPNASINAKNAAPTIDKQVKEDADDQWGKDNTADIGQDVEFRTTISVHEGAENFVLHDTMSAGLTFKGVTRVERIIPGSTQENNVTETATPGTDYTVVDKTTDSDIDCTFEVRFSQDFCDELDTNDKVVVYYTAMLNRNAVIAGTGNTNEAKLEYGDDHFTTESETTTKTFAFDLVKTDGQYKLLDGAEFRIYDAVTGGNEVPVVLMDDGVTYRRARTDETGVSIVVKDGKVRVVGFDNGTYYLEETVTPSGYNQLATRQKFIIADKNYDAIIRDNVASTDSGVIVVNKSGTMLPETGGMGTTLFITFGAIAVLGTGALLVTKKRMGMIQD